jgi:hypothetical protein
MFWVMSICSKNTTGVQLQRDRDAERLKQTLWFRARQSGGFRRFDIRVFADSLHRIRRWRSNSRSLAA